MIQIDSPWPDIGNTDSITLPDPVYGNNERLGVKIDFKQSMNGVIYTYVRVKEPGKIQLGFTFQSITSLFYHETIEPFFDEHNAEWMRIVDDRKNQQWKVKFLNNPLVFVCSRRIGTCILEADEEELVEAGNLELSFRGDLI